MIRFGLMEACGRASRKLDSKRAVVHGQPVNIAS
jgi:hypothetical protein